MQLQMPFWGRCPLVVAATTCVRTRVSWPQTLPLSSHLGVVLFLLAWVAAAAGASRRQTSSRAAAQEAQADLPLLVLQELNIDIESLIDMTVPTRTQCTAQHNSEERTSRILRKSCAIVHVAALQKSRADDIGYLERRAQWPCNIKI